MGEVSKNTQETRLFYLLKSLDYDEFRWLYKFVKSPYHNSSQHIVKLYELLRKHHPDFDDPKLTQKYIYNKLFPKTEPDLQRLRLLFHRFTKVVEAFIVAQKIKSDDILYKKLVTQSLSRINTYELFRKKTKALLEEMESSPYRDEHFFKNSEALHLGYYGHPATNRQQEGAAYLIKAMENLDDYFVLSKIKMACALKARERTMSESFDVKYLEVVHEHSKGANILILIYSQILELQRSEDNVSIFDYIRKLFDANLDQIGQDDKRNILQFLINFCTRIINKGETHFVKYSLDLFRIGLKYDCLFANGELSQTTFNNIVMSGIGCKEFEWTRSFIEQYGEQLNNNVRLDTITYSRAFWYFSQNEFEKTIHLIISYSFTKPLQIIGSKSLLIRTYVELFLEDDSYYDLSMSQINTFEKYIRNHDELSERVSEAYLNFAKFTKKLVRLKYQMKSDGDFKDRLESTRNVILKNWLLEKLRR